MRKAALLIISAALHAAVLALAMTWPSPMPEVMVIREIRDVVPLPPLNFFNRDHADSPAGNGPLVFNPLKDEIATGNPQPSALRTEPAAVADPGRGDLDSVPIPQVSRDADIPASREIAAATSPETNLRSHLWNPYTGSLTAHEKSGTGQTNDMPAGLDFRTGLHTPGLIAWSKLAVARIARNWLRIQPRSSEFEATLRVPIVVDKSGTIVMVLPDKGRHGGETTAAVERAIRSASPLPRLPEGFPGDQLNAVLVFSNP